MTAPFRFGLPVALALGTAACHPEACSDPAIAMPISVTMRLESFMRISAPDKALSDEECTEICQAFEPTLLVVDNCDVGDPQFPDGGTDTASVTGLATITIACSGRFACP